MGCDAKTGVCGINCYLIIYLKCAGVDGGTADSGMSNRECRGIEGSTADSAPTYSERLGTHVSSTADSATADSAFCHNFHFHIINMEFATTHIEFIHMNRFITCKSKGTTLRHIPDNRTVFILDIATDSQITDIQGDCTLCPNPIGYNNIVEVTRGIVCTVCSNRDIAFGVWMLKRVVLRPRRHGREQCEEDHHRRPRHGKGLCSFVHNDKGFICLYFVYSDIFRNFAAENQTC